MRLRGLRRWSVLLARLVLLALLVLTVLLVQPAVTVRTGYQPTR